MESDTPLASRRAFLLAAGAATMRAQAPQTVSYVASVKPNLTPTRAGSPSILPEDD
jgi:hypothetical protein